MKVRASLSMGMIAFAAIVGVGYAYMKGGR